MRRVAFVSVLLVAGCGSSDAATPDDASPTADVAVDGAAVDAPVSDADVLDAPIDAPVDPCTTAKPVCPTPPTTGAGKGLVAIDRCAFPMKASAAWSTSGALIGALETITGKATVADVVASANRNAVAANTAPGSPPGFQLGFRWNAEDEASTTWTPQGISGSPDGTANGLVAGKLVVLVSFYHSPAGSDPNKGARIAFVDLSDPKLPVYRHVLLVTPTGTTAAPSIAPVLLHVGGIAWFSHYLYVAATGSGFRVFDLDHLLPMKTDQDVIGCSGGQCRAGLYAYALPEVGAYVSQSTCDDLFSFVSLDRSTTAPSLLTGEYCSATACATPLAGRLRRFELDPVTGRLSSAPTFWPSEAFFMHQTQVQGAASVKGVHYLSSSAPAGGAGALYRVVVGKSATSTWIDAPEDMMVDGANDRLFSLSEAVGARTVAAFGRASYPPP